MEFLLFKINNQFYGIESTEITKVIEIDKLKNTELLNEADKLIYTKQIFNCDDEIKMALVMKSKEHQKILFFIPYMEDLLDIPESLITPLSEFLRKNQKPFFSWAISEVENKLIILITFDYYFKQKG